MTDYSNIGANAEPPIESSYTVVKPRVDGAAFALAIIVGLTIFLGTFVVISMFAPGWVVGIVFAVMLIEMGLTAIFVRSMQRSDWGAGRSEREKLDNDRTANLHEREGRVWNMMESTIRGLRLEVQRLWNENDGLRREIERLRRNEVAPALPSPSVESDPVEMIESPHTTKRWIEYREGEYARVDLIEGYIRAWFSTSKPAKADDFRSYVRTYNQLAFGQTEYSLAINALRFIGIVAGDGGGTKVIVSEKAAWKLIDGALDAYGTDSVPQLRSIGQR